MREQLSVFVEGLLGYLPRTNCEPNADTLGIPPRTLQQFSSLLAWDRGSMKTKLQRLVAKERVRVQSIGVSDETACPQKGEKLSGVQRP